MCRYCSYDIPLHYQINHAPQLNSSIDNSGVRRQDSEESAIRYGAPEFNNQEWDFGGTEESQLYPQLAVVDRQLNFTFAENIFQDADHGDVLTYSATLNDDSPLPNWLQIDPATGRFTGIPDMVGTLDLKLRVSDGTLSDEVTFTLEILPDEDSEYSLLEDSNNL